MDTFILIILIVICIWALTPIISRWIQRKIAEHLVKRMTGGRGGFGGMNFGDLNDLFNQANKRQNRAAQQQQEAVGHRRARNFMRQVSETVSYEEIGKAADNYNTPGDHNNSEASNRSIKFDREQQITDVEWEDL